MPNAMNLAEPLGSSWRVSLDRAWRSESFRRRFESETGLAPLAETETGKQEQANSGHAQAYHDRFLTWATKQLNLENQAPPDIQRKLSS